MKRSLLLLGGLLAVVPANAQKLTDQFPVKPGKAAGKAPGKTGKPSKPAGPSQAARAAKGAFLVVKTAAVKGAIAATDLAAARKLNGKTATFVGVVDKVYAPKSNGVVLLNFAKDYKTALVGAVQAKDFAAFPNLAQLKGKKVTVSGKVVIFKGAPEVMLEKAGAIKIVK